MLAVSLRVLTLYFPAKLVLATKLYTEFELLPSASASITSISAWRGASSAVHGVRRSPVASHLHPKLPPVEQRTVHGVHGVLRVALVEETHKGKPAALFGVPIAGNVDISHTAVLLKNASQSLGRSSIRKVVHFQGGHSLHVWRRPPVAHVLRCVKLRMIKGKLLLYRQAKRRPITAGWTTAVGKVRRSRFKGLQIKRFLPRHAAHMKWRQQRFPSVSLCALCRPPLIGGFPNRFSSHWILQRHLSTRSTGNIMLRIRPLWYKTICFITIL